MNQTVIRKSCAGAALAAALLGTVVGAHAAPLPPIHTEGAVAYMSGGIGQDESAAMQAEGRKWPVTLEFAINQKPRAEFAADVQVQVRDARGQTVLQTRADGPFLLARLAPGRYQVNATLQGRTLHRAVSVKGHAPAKAVFVWPAGTAESGA